MTELSEAEVARSLVARILNGEAAAETEMVQRYNRGLVFMLNHRARNHALAEDLAQETWRIVIEKVRGGDLKDPSKLAAFIVQTGKNQLLMIYRGSHHKKTTTEVDTAQSLDPASQPQLIIERYNTALIVRKLVDEMKTPRDRELILRFYIKEEEKQQICQDLGLNELHFNRVLFRARQRFKQLWNEYVEAGADP
ncbi:sigma-70 family RNA polymerase sigma factor [Thalassomonas sp. RHCl1]|uniref:RNA polymerase sigma factor n=1 Tax=Thalassomonas sp. RHCl1 TaxID=2995320 RepID=UPI00248D1012|nr:sigma-70 family RNA polymerase sigma factor [Thalassomonas sp. RHCl1]